MAKILRFAFFVLLAPAPASAFAQSPNMLAHWVQMAPGGMSEIRVIVEGTSCPTATVDGAKIPLQLRAAPNEKFAVRLCVLPLGPGARQAQVMGEELHLPKAAPDRIVIFGDTGCRITNWTIQNCNNPADWPFPQVAAAAAKLKPDLVIHVGDYLYREKPCPDGDARCAGSPSGDNWSTWAADFFTPGKPLLGAAPWAIVRGNHEECSRAGVGFLRLLGPLPVVEGASCMLHVQPYAVSLGAMDLIVMDNASAIDCCRGMTGVLCFFSCGPSDGLIDTYRQDFAALPSLSSKPIWLAMHHPIWGVVQLSHGMTGGGNATLIDAEDSTGLPANTNLLLAGHIHTFEAINYERGLPPQLIVGEGGDRLDKAPPDLTGQTIFTAKIADGFSLPGYGFVLLTRKDDGWNVDVFDAAGAHERSCTYASRHISCSKA